MSIHQLRQVNLIPPHKIKKEVIDVYEDDVVGCKICTKTFASEMALTNHAKLEHFDAYCSGDSSLWKEYLVIKSKEEIKREEKALIKHKTEEIISAMAPNTLMKLANEDVSYIIIKEELDDDKSTIKPRISRRHKEEHKKKDDDGKKAEKSKTSQSRNVKEVQPITGPFECLQPSTLVAEGLCHQIFFSCCEYSTHFRDEHTRRRKGHRCQVCEKPLAPGLDNVHYPFPCEICGDGFMSSKDLTSHNNTVHIKLKPYECTICQKRFTQKGGIQQHMRMHTGDRPFKCTYCPKTFTQKSGLGQHLRIHTKTKPYQCVVCQKTFCQSVHLKQHMRTHTNVAPFQCGICQKRFKQSSHLNYHLRSHNTINMTEEQRKKYAELLGMIEYSGEVIEHSNELIEVEIGVDQGPVQEQHQEQYYEQEQEYDQVEEQEYDQEQEQEYDQDQEQEYDQEQEQEYDQEQAQEYNQEEEQYEQTEEEMTQNMLEQAEAEQSVQVELGEDAYIIPDTWGVEVVDS